MNRTLSRIWFFTMFGSLLLTIVLSSEIAAQKTQGEATFYYGGTWILHQDGLGPITMEIQRIGSEITGKASYDAGRKGIARGTVQGRAWSETYPPTLWTGPLTINHFEVEIRWNDAVGIYHGTNFEKIPLSSYEAELCRGSIQSTPACNQLIPRNSLAGEGWSKAAPAVIVRWHTDPVFRPLPPPVPSAPPAPPPLKSTGKMPKSEPAPPKPPYIFTSQPIIPTPSHPFGIVGMSWDGGPNYPNVEVWLSMDNGVEIPAFSIGQTAQSPVWKQPKNGFALQLLRNHQYRFVLRAGGTNLASSVAVVVP